MESTTYRTERTHTLVAAENIADVGVMLAVSTSAGTGYKASDAASRRVVGIVKTGDNGTVGYIASTSENVTALSGYSFLLGNSSTSPLAAKDIGGYAYVEDEVTVCTTTGSTHKLIAGVVDDVTTAGVYVFIGPDYVAASS